MDINPRIHGQGRADVPRHERSTSSELHQVVNRKDEMLIREKLDIKCLLLNLHNESTI